MSAAHLADLAGQKLNKTHANHGDRRLLERSAAPEAGRRAAGGGLAGSLGERIMSALRRAAITMAAIDLLLGQKDNGQAARN